VRIKSVKIENNSDDWVWDFVMDSVINAYHALVKKRFGDMYFMIKKDKLR